mgnify:CR=1 FL=1
MHEQRWVDQGLELELELEPGLELEPAATWGVVMTTCTGRRRPCGKTRCRRQGIRRYDMIFAICDMGRKQFEIGDNDMELALYRGEFSRMTFI